MKYHPILKTKISCWKELETQISKLQTTKEMGDVFEQYVYGYLFIKQNLYQIAELYIFKDIPLKYKKLFKLEKNDCGVDGLIIFKDGRSAAYQAKFRSERKQPTYAELTKFWVEAKLTNYNYTIANSYSLSKLCGKHSKHLSILVDEFDKLDKGFFNKFYQLTNAKHVASEFYIPDKFQKRMINNVLQGFSKHSRGKLIAACGTGKTLTALWISERMLAKKVLFLAPSLALIKQTLESWSEQARNNFSYLCVCSDKTVSAEVDNGDISLSDFNVPVTTSPEIVSKYLSLKSTEKQVVFSTYQSLDVLAEAINKLSDFAFNLTIFDEAHRTAGAKNSTLFSLALYDQNIPAEKRLFMTATERLVRPAIIKKAKEYNRVVFSMDDPKLYGPVFDRFNFGEAIENQIISDYRIVVAGVREKDIYDWIKENKLLVQVDKKSKEFHMPAQNIFRQVMLVKVMKEFSINKCITFHSTIKNAKAFIDGCGPDDLNLEGVFYRLWKKLAEPDIYLDHINGTMNAGERKKRLSLFKDTKHGILSNARCLIEGVDLPIIDSTYFVNSKNSLIDIVQACGRALRKPRDKHDKKAYFIVPILIPDDTIGGDAVNKIDFEMLFNLIQSLREQDVRLAQWINVLNFNASTGGGGGGGNGDGPIVFDLPEEFDVKSFSKELYLKIADVNGDPTSIRRLHKTYGKRERKSQYKRIFKTLGDYSVDSYRDHLVLPTIRRFTSEYQLLPMDTIKINHNNISHTERLGLIVKDNKKYKLSPLGIQLFRNKIEFKSVFKRQMLRYFSLVSDKQGNRILFPYRACLKILLEVKSINFIEFVFCIYSMIDYSENSINEAIEDIKYIRNNYSNVEILNKVNKPKILEELNKYFITSFSETDIWAKKTTISNQYIYFRNHLALFEEHIKIDNKLRTISLAKNTDKSLVTLLTKDVSCEKIKDSNILMKQYIQELIIFVLFGGF